MASTSMVTRAIARFVVAIGFAWSAGLTLAQPTMFTYQGRLTDAGLPANATYEMQFKLFDALADGAQIGTTLTNAAVVVTEGLFTVGLDFTAAAFDGSPRFLEIGVRPAGSADPFTTLAPRQPMTSAPYAIRSLTANPAPGSGNYIQNTVTPQAGASFNIAGTGTIGGDLTVTGAGNGVVFPDGSKQTTAGGAGGVSGSGTTNTIPLWSGGTVLGNSLITQSASTVQLPALVQLAPTPGGNQIQFGSPNTETGMSISGAVGRADLRFDGSALKLVAGPAGGPPAATNGIAIGTDGAVKIGATTIPAGSSQAKLYVRASEAPGNAGVTGVGFYGVIGQTPTAGGTIGFGVYSFGRLGVNTLDEGGDTPLCRHGTSLALSLCGSSLRYKTDLQPFSGGMDIVRQLRPLTYKWKSTNTADVGFGAEDVAGVDPLFAARNAKGEIEGVKYDRLSAVFVNAFKEQQAQIEEQRAHVQEQQAQIERQRQRIEHQDQQIDALKTIVCQLQPAAALCR